jgi:hypothetical protein
MNKKNNEAKKSLRYCVDKNSPTILPITHKEGVRNTVTQKNIFSRFYTCHNKQHKLKTQIRSAKKKVAQHATFLNN